MSTAKWGDFTWGDGTVYGSLSINDYLSLVIPEHRSQTKFIAWLTAALDIILDIQSVLTDMKTYFDIDAAVGDQLDAIGVILGQSRLLDFQPTSGSALLDDDNYRLVLRAKILRNQWDGTLSGYKSMMSTVLSGYEAVIVDYQNMTIDVAMVLLGSTNTLAGELLESGYLLPKPSGVATNFAVALPGEWYWYYFQSYTWSSVSGYTFDELAAGI
jgi:hypothetical protein